MTRMNVRYTALFAAAAAIAASVSCSDDSSGPKVSNDITKVNHVVVIYLENRAFDNTYGEFAGAAGLADAASALPQVDSAGHVVRHAAAGCGTAVSDESPQRAIRHRAVRTAHRRDARPRASLLPGAGADRRREDGQVRDRERREGVEHGALPHVGAPDGRPKRRTTCSRITSSTARSAARFSITNSSSRQRRPYFPARPHRRSPCSTPRGTSSPMATSRPMASR